MWFCWQISVVAPPSDFCHFKAQFHLSWLDSIFCKNCKYFQVLHLIQKEFWTKHPVSSLFLFACRKNRLLLDCFANVTLIGDGFCNDETNNADCNYDGGDCCVNINMTYCSNCTCHHRENCLAGFIPSVVGDGFCDDGTNNADCHYDGGDCCKYNKIPRNSKTESY